MERGHHIISSQSRSSQYYHIQSENQITFHMGNSVSGHQLVKREQETGKVTGKAAKACNSKDANSVSIAIFTILIPFTAEKVGWYTQGWKLNLCLLCEYHALSHLSSVLSPF